MWFAVGDFKGYIVGICVEVGLLFVEFVWAEREFLTMLGEIYGLRL